VHFLYIFQSLRFTFAHGTVQYFSRGRWIPHKKNTAIIVTVLCYVWSKHENRTVEQYKVSHSFHWLQHTNKTHKHTHFNPCYLFSELDQICCALRLQWSHLKNRTVSISWIEKVSASLLLVHVHGVRLFLWTAASKGTCSLPGDKCVESHDEMISTRENSWFVHQSSNSELDHGEGSGEFYLRNISCHTRKVL
jgi:hypothetical protein